MSRGLHSDLQTELATDHLEQIHLIEFLVQTCTHPICLHFERRAIVLPFLSKFRFIIRIPLIGRMILHPQNGQNSSPARNFTFSIARFLHTPRLVDQVLHHRHFFIIMDYLNPFTGGPVVGDLPRRGHSCQSALRFSGATML